jgi:hypothetical protein
VVALSPWLELMVAEIARKREEHERAHSEQSRRDLERARAPAGEHAGSEAAHAPSQPGAPPARR